MTVTFYTNTSDKIVLDKDITALLTVTGTLKNETSITSPVMMFSDIDSIISDTNYVYIAEFNRYYFVNEIRSIRNNLWEISMHVDVLKTYADSIRENSAIIGRQQEQYNLYLNDGLFKTQQNPRIEQYSFPTGFTQLNFVLALAGS